MNTSVTLAGRSLALALGSLLLAQAHLQAQALKQTARTAPGQPANPVARGATTIQRETRRSTWKPDHVTLAIAGAESTVPEALFRFASAASTPVSEQAPPTASAAPSLSDGEPIRGIVPSIQAVVPAPAPAANQASRPAGSSGAQPTRSALERRYPDLVKSEPRFWFAPGEMSVDPITRKPQGLNLISFRF